MIGHHLKHTLPDIHRDWFFRVRQRFAASSFAFTSSLFHTKFLANIPQFVDLIKLFIWFFQLAGIYLSIMNYIAIPGIICRRRKRGVMRVNELQVGDVFKVLGTNYIVHEIFRNRIHYKILHNIDSVWKTMGNDDSFGVNSQQLVWYMCSWGYNHPDKPPSLVTRRLRQSVLYNELSIAND